MSLWQKVKKLAKDHIEENRAFKAELSELSDKQLHQKAKRVGGKYADAYVERKRKAREMSQRIKRKMSKKIYEKTIGRTACIHHLNKKQQEELYESYQEALRLLWEEIEEGIKSEGDFD